MSKQRARRVSVVLVAALSLVCMGGCMKVKEEDRFQTIKVPQEKLTQIETLDVEAMKAEPDAELSEPNEPAPELELTLEEVRAITLENNLELKVQLLNPTMADESVKATEAKKYEVVLSSGITHSRTDRPDRDTDLSGTKQENTSVNLGVSVPLQTGGSIAFTLDEYSQKTNRFGTDFPEAFSTPFGLSVSQPLLRGAGKREFMHSIRLARYDAQYVGARTKLEIIRVISVADQAYWDLYKKRRILEVRHQQYTLAEAQLDRARRFVDAGQNPQVDLIRAQAGLAGQLSIIIAAENDLRISQRNLKQILNKPNLPVEGPTVLVPTTEADPVFLWLDRDKLVDFATDNRMDMLQLELDIARNLSEIEHLRNAGLPDLSLRYRYGVSGLGTNRHDAYDMLLDKNFEDHSLSLSLQYPLGNKVARSNLRSSLYSRRQKQAQRRDLEAVIEKQILDALDGIETSWQQILANRQSAILDGRLYEAEQRQFVVGMRTSTDVLEAQARFANSQSAEYEALANYQIAMIELARSTGTLLGAAKIEWEASVPDVGIAP